MVLNILNILEAGVLTTVLLCSHYLCRYLKFIPGFSRKHFSSFASGVIASYVFLHMLPALVESRDRVHVLLSSVSSMTSFQDLIVFIVALFGFELFYVLERITAGKKNSAKLNHQHRFKLNLSLYCLYNFLITYTLMERLETGSWYGVIFTAAIGIHFVISDNRFNRYFPHLFGVKAHLILVAALFLGYLASILFPANIYWFALLSAFLSGAILYNAFSEEIALNRESSMLLFFIGSALMAGLLSLLLIR